MIGFSIFKEPGYLQSWAVLRDLKRLSIAVGFKGLVLLFDEFDDIVDKLGNLKLLKIALSNLFRFLQPELFDGKSFFAVTPDFEKKCRDEFVRKRQGDYDLSRLVSASISHDRSQSKRSPHAGGQNRRGPLDRLRLDHRYCNGVRQNIETLVREASQSIAKNTLRQVVRAVVECLDQQLEGHA